MRQKIYHDQYVGPFNKMKRKLKLFKEKQIQEEHHSRGAKQAASLSNSKVREQILALQKISMTIEQRIALDRRIRRISISDYFNGKTIKGEKETSPINKIANKTNEKEGQVEPNANNILKNEQTIFHTDEQHLKLEYIDQQKAVTLMHKIKQLHEQEPQATLDKIEVDFRYLNERVKKREWQEFVEFAQNNPDTLLDLVEAEPPKANDEHYRFRERKGFSAQLTSIDAINVRAPSRGSTDNKQCYDSFLNKKETNKRSISPQQTYFTSQQLRPQTAIVSTNVSPKHPSMLIYNQRISKKRTIIRGAYNTNAKDQQFASPVQNRPVTACTDVTIQSRYSRFQQRSKSMLEECTKELRKVTHSVVKSNTLGIFGIPPKTLAVKKKLNGQAVSAINKPQQQEQISNTGLQYGSGGAIKVSSILSSQKLEDIGNGVNMMNADIHQQILDDRAKDIIRESVDVASIHSRQNQNQLSHIDHISHYFEDIYQRMQMVSGQQPQLDQDITVEHPAQAQKALQNEPPLVQGDTQLTIAELPPASSNDPIPNYIQFINRENGTLSSNTLGLGGPAATAGDNVSSTNQGQTGVTPKELQSKSFFTNKPETPLHNQLSKVKRLQSAATQKRKLIEAHARKMAMSKLSKMKALPSKTPDVAAMPQKSDLILPVSNGRLLDNLKVFPQKLEGAQTDIMGQTINFSQFANANDGILNSKYNAQLLSNMKLLQQQQNSFDKNNNHPSDHPLQSPQSLSTKLAKRLKIYKEPQQRKNSLNNNKRQPNNSGKQFDGPQNIQMTDWKFSRLRQKLKAAQTNAGDQTTNRPYFESEQLMFNREKDQSIYREEEVEYMINMLKYNSKDFDLTLITPLFNKALATLQRLMSPEELNVPHLFERMESKLIDITVEMTLKLLLRCRMMLDCRGQILRILQIIEAREEMLRRLNLFVLKGVTNEGDLRESRENELGMRVSELNEITESLITRVRELLGSRRIFGPVFLFDGMDYCKVVLHEMRQLKLTLATHGYDVLPSQAQQLEKQKYYLTKREKKDRRPQTSTLEQQQLSRRGMDMMSGGFDHLNEAGLSQSILGLDSTELLFGQNQVATSQEMNKRYHQQSHLQSTMIAAGQSFGELDKGK